MKTNPICIKKPSHNSLTLIVFKSDTSFLLKYRRIRMWNHEAKSFATSPNTSWPTGSFSMKMQNFKNIFFLYAITVTYVWPNLKLDMKVINQRFENPWSNQPLWLSPLISFIESTSTISAVIAGYKQQTYSLSSHQNLCSVQSFSNFTMTLHFPWLLCVRVPLPLSRSMNWKLARGWAYWLYVCGVYVCLRTYQVYMYVECMYLCVYATDVCPWSACMFVQIASIYVCGVSICLCTCHRCMCMEYLHVCVNNKYIWLWSVCMFVYIASIYVYGVSVCLCTCHGCMCIEYLCVHTEYICMSSVCMFVYMPYIFVSRVSVYLCTCHVYVCRVTVYLCTRQVCKASVYMSCMTASRRLQWPNFLRGGH